MDQGDLDQISGGQSDRKLQDQLDQKIDELITVNNEFKDKLVIKSKKFMENHSWERVGETETIKVNFEEIKGSQLLFALVSMVQHPEYKEHDEEETGTKFQFEHNRSILFTVEANPQKRKKGNGKIEKLGFYKKPALKEFSEEEFRQFLAEPVSEPPVDLDLWNKWKHSILFLFEIARRIPKSVAYNEADNHHIKHFEDVPAAFVIYAWLQVEDIRECDIRAFKNCPFNDYPNYSW